MTAQLNVRLTDVTKDLVTAIRSIEVPVAKAAKLAIVDAGTLLKTTARGHIRSAGFSNRWANAYRVRIYPSAKDSIDAAAFGFLAVDFSDIFGLGGTISGHPLLWLPFGKTPRIDRRKPEADIKDYKNAGIKLYTMKGLSKPTLGANVEMSRSQARQRIVTVSLADIKRGKKLSRGRKSLGVIMRTIPLFFGVPAVTIKRRFNWDAVQQQVMTAVPGFYDSHINDLADQ